MKIIVAPHQTLRETAQEIKSLDKKIISFVAELEKTLKKKDKPKGVGLAAPQVNKKLRIFATQLPIEDTSSRKNNPNKNDINEDGVVEKLEIKHFINPVIINHAPKFIFGETEQDKKPLLEGCLSIPKIYAPVPRWPWIELKYQVIKQGKLVQKTSKFADFAARVIQHETDHLNGILFTDYAVKYDLSIYLENEKTGQFDEITNREILKNL